MVPQLERVSPALAEADVNGRRVWATRPQRPTPNCLTINRLDAFALGCAGQIRLRRAQTAPNSPIPRDPPTALFGQQPVDRPTPIPLTQTDPNSTHCRDSQTDPASTAPHPPQRDRLRSRRDYWLALGNI